MSSAAVYPLAWVRRLRASKLKVCWSHHDAAAAAADDGGDGDVRPHHSGHKGDTAAIGDDVDDVVDSNAGGGVDADVGADADTDADSCVWADAMPVPIVVPMRMPVPVEMLMLMGMVLTMPTTLARTTTTTDLPNSCKANIPKAPTPAALQAT